MKMAYESLSTCSSLIMACSSKKILILNEKEGCQDSSSAKDLENFVVLIECSAQNYNREE
jgi:hypothetical protein